MMKNKKQRWMLAPVVCLLLGCAGPEPAGQPLHSVVTMKAGTAGTRVVKTFSGVVKEKAEVSLGFKTGGQIERIYVKEGDRVRGGQLLAQLDTADYRLAVDAAESRYVQLRGELARLRRLYEGKSLSANDFEKAESGLRQTEVEWRMNRNKLAYTRLYAPADGYIQSVNNEEAEMVNAGTPVFSLLTAGPMKVEVSLPLEVCRHRDDMTGVSCRWRDRPIAVRLLSITPKADAVQLYKALLLVEGQEADLSAGMNVEVDIELQTRVAEGSLALPVQAVFNEDGKDYVWVVGADSTVSRREVTVGTLDGEGRLVVTGGLAGDEEIVRAGVHALHEREKVKVLPPVAATNIGGLL